MNNNTNEKIQIHLNSKHASKYNNEHYSDCDFALPIIEAESQYTLYIKVFTCSNSLFLLQYQFKK